MVDRGQKATGGSTACPRDETGQTIQHQRFLGITNAQNHADPVTRHRDQHHTHPHRPNGCGDPTFTAGRPSASLDR